MKVFTYSEYIKYIHLLRLNAVFQLAEENSEYALTQKRYNKKIHDGMVKSILKDEKELSNFINKFITTELELRPIDLVKFTNSYITKKYKSKEADLVYKLKNQDIFFLIEHQSTVDNSMPYRMLNYCIDIMYEWCKSKKLEQIEEYPLIVPIVIYTGDRKWNVTQDFSDKQISTAIFENYKINFNYNLIDINKISVEILLEQNSMFGYGMIIEKAKNKKDLLEKIDLIIKNCNDEKQLEELKNIILYALDNSLNNIEQEEIIEKIEMKVGDKTMSTLIDRLTAENRRILNQGIKKGMETGIKTGIKTGMKTGMKTGIKTGIETQRNDVVKRMLAMKFKDNIILEVSGATQQELEKIKRNTKSVKK